MSLGSIKLSIWNEYLSALVMVVSIVILLLYAPIGHRNKQLEEIEVLVYKKRLRWILVAITVIFVALLLAKQLSLVFAVSSALVLSSFMFLVVKVKMICGIF